MVCREFLAAVSEHPWEDRGTVIQGSIAAWRACFRAPMCSSGAETMAQTHFEGQRELHMAAGTSQTPLLCTCAEFTR